MNFPPQVILDTNLLISGLISNRLIQFNLYFDVEKIQLLRSEKLVAEFLEVASRPKFRKYFEEKEAEQLAFLFCQFSKNVEVKSWVSVCRDEKDNFLLALAQDGKADFLVTGDSDLLDLRTFGQTTILKHADFVLLTQEF